MSGLVETARSETPRDLAWTRVAGGVLSVPFRSRINLQRSNGTAGIRDRPCGTSDLPGVGLAARASGGPPTCLPAACDVPILC